MRKSTSPKRQIEHSWALYSTETGELVAMCETRAVAREQQNNYPNVIIRRIRVTITPE